MNFTLTLPALYYICLAIYSLTLIINAVRKLRVYKIVDYLLVIFLITFFYIILVLFGGELGWWDFMGRVFKHQLPFYGLLIFSGVFYGLTYAVFKNENPGWVWLVSVILVLAITIAADAVMIFSKRASWENLGGLGDLSYLSNVILTFGWMVFVILSTVQVLSQYRTTERSIVKQRAIYWISGLICFIGGFVLFFTHHEIVGSALLVMVIIIISYLALTYRLPDLKILTIRISEYSLTGITIILLYALGFLVLERIFLELAWYEPVYNGVFFFLVALIIFFPILRSVRSILYRFQEGDKARTLEIRNYSKTLSSILDIELLSKVTIEMICDSLEVKKGTLFLVDRIETDREPPNWRLRAVQGTTETLPDLEILPANSPITKVLAEEKRPLTQSELEFIPKFQTIPKNVVGWIKALEVDAFVPIHTKDEWIGLFALSQKRSGASFTDDELDLLSSLADQTSVALQNARLVESISKIDSQLRRARASKDTALDNIERIKKSATDIISIKAHELRSPLTVVSGYSQLLANDEKIMEDEYYSELINGIISGSDGLQKIIENMISAAAVQPKNLNIDTKPISLYYIVDSVCRELQEKVQARKITLSHDNLGEIPPVYGDSGALKKVFEILINYAMTHTPSGGKITITGQHIPPRSELLKWEGAEIVVCDTGIGIGAEIKGRFFQEHMNPVRTDFSDLDELAAGEIRPGEELAIVRSIIEAHNGRVWVERVEKDTEHLPGSEFHVVLPLEQQSLSTQPK